MGGGMVRDDGCVFLWEQLEEGSGAPMRSTRTYSTRAKLGEDPYLSSLPCIINFCLNEADGGMGVSLAFWGKSSSSVADQGNVVSELPSPVASPFTRSRSPRTFQGPPPSELKQCVPSLVPFVGLSFSPCSPSVLEGA